jgi:hypothetical protein
MPARIFEKVHVGNLAGNELQAVPGGVAGTGRARLRRSPTCKKQSAGLFKYQTYTPMYLRPIRMTGANVPMHRCRCAEVCGPLKKTSRTLLFMLPNTCAIRLVRRSCLPGYLQKCMSGIQRAMNFMRSRAVWPAVVVHGCAAHQLARNSRLSFANTNQIHLCTLGPFG